MPSPSDDTIDSRDIIEEIRDLESEISGLQDDVTQLEEENEDLQGEIDELEDTEEVHGENADAIAVLETDIETNDLDISTKGSDIDDLKSELDPLTDLQEQAEPYAADWRHGVTLIADDYFEDYAYELAKDIGAVNEDMGWPCDCIDWVKAADALKMDYTSVEFDGCTYWVRS